MHQKHKGILLSTLISRTSRFGLLVLLFLLPCFLMVTKLILKLLIPSTHFLCCGKGNALWEKNAIGRLKTLLQPSVVGKLKNI